MKNIIKTIVLSVIMVNILLVTNIKAQALTMCSGQVLGEAQSFNVFVRNDVNLFNSDTEGRMAAGGNIYLKNYSVGLKLSNSNGNRDDLISNSNITFINGKVENGNAVYANTGNFTNVEIPNGTAKQGNVIDFNSAFSNLISQSNKLASFSSNGSAQNINGDLVLSGNDGSQNIFNVSSSDISNAYNIIINVPNGSTTLVNISGNSVQIKNQGISGQNLNSSKILWNMNNALSLNLENVGIYGSILAPNANVNFNSAVQNGNVVAKTLNGGSDNSPAGQSNFNAGQNNYSQFNGCISDPGATETTPVPTATPITTPTSTPTPTNCNCGSVGGETTSVPPAQTTTTPTVGSVLGESTGAVLANTGEGSTLLNLLLGASILGFIGAMLITRNPKILVNIKK